jgi:hypothetical protein
MKNNIYCLYNEFEWKWLKHKGFWRLLWFAIVAKFGITTTNKEAEKGCYFSIGSTQPVRELWIKGYSVSYAGKILGETVLFYQQPRKPATFGNAGL